MHFNIRVAETSDSALIFGLIQELAEYEKMRDDVVTTEEELRKQIFEKKFANVLIAEVNNEAVGFALYFFNFSTFVGKPGLYLEDLFIRPEHRGKGYGKKLFIKLTKIAAEENCGRMEWSVLNWNTPAINFYTSLNAIPMDEWTLYRLTEREIENLAAE